MTKPFLLTLEYPPQIGGIAQYLKAEVDNFDGEVAVLSASANKKLSWVALLWRARKEYRRQGCNALWISHVLPIGYIALVWKWMFKTPYRVFVHGLDLVRPLKSPWKKFWVKKILKNADEIIANSRATEKLLDNYSKDAMQGISIQYPRIAKIDIEKYKPFGKQLRHQYNINDKPLLLTISRLVKRKGTEFVLRALPEIWKTIPDLVFVIVGDGEEMDRLSVIANPAYCGVKQSYNRTEQDISDNQIHRNDKIYPRIIFAGPASDESKYAWLSTCDCFIMTPINDPNDFEGYGIVYKEAQMFQKPVIGSRVGGVPEAIGDKGVLVKPENIDQITNAVINQISLSFPRRG